MTDIRQIFGEMVFSQPVMKARLPKETYNALKDTIRRGAPLDPQLAGVVAAAMKDWAIEKGATHYTHWFQPLTGVTAEKHDSFIAPTKDGSAILEFSGKELVMGEPDASSFPSGGLRSTFEARGYTAWDPTCCAFIKDSTLCIPTVFCSYGGEALDKKTPLLRSMELINHHTMRILRVFGMHEARHVFSMVGAEQEYFLVDRALYERRRDLLFCSRTLFGAKPPKGQELDDHYFGAIAPRVQAFMKELDDELWRVGVYAKTEHKEAAPGQYELAPIYTNANIATDHNQITMELLKRTALKHGFVCLLHEKPFDGLNGSGKHNNWSLATDTGVNLLKPGGSERENTLFLLVLAAIMKAVDDYQDLLRVSVVGASNDLRLGGFEAPPAIVSMYLGDELTSTLSAIENGDDYAGEMANPLESGVNTVPILRKDSTDRNRTSPFAFTGNKFEFRMPGASHSIADANTVINTIVGESLAGFADALEAATDTNAAASALIRDTLRKHKRILFSGNCYAPEWAEEAERRGLLNLPTTIDALPCFVSEKNIALFTKHGIFTEREMRSRYEIQLENYAMVISIEARTMLEMVRRDILPAIFAYEKQLADTALSKERLGVAHAPESAVLSQLSALCETLHRDAEALGAALEAAEAIGPGLERCRAFRDDVYGAMAAVRRSVDALEPITAKHFWPFPTYEDLLYGIY